MREDGAFAPLEAGLLYFAGFFVVGICWATIQLDGVHWYGILRWLAAGALFTISLSLLALVSRRHPAAFTPWRMDAILAFAGVGLGAYVCVSGHRLYVLLLALAQILMVRTVVPAATLPQMLAIFAASAIAWACGAGFSYTPLHDALLNAPGSFALFAPAFVLALVMVAREAVSARSLRDEDARTRWAVWVPAILAFALLALRSDNLLTDWVPYHRSYVVAPAELVRTGRWLLWDVPAQYGFLSTLTVALAPGKTAWDSLGNLTFVILSVQAAVLFWLFRWRSSGIRNALVAFAVTTATVFSCDAARYPLSLRLYPQGGLRFIWPFALLAIAFALWTRERSRRSTRTLLVVGYAVWGCAILWSFEVAAWSTLIWLAYLLTSAFRDVTAKRHSITSAAWRLAPIALVPAAAIGTVELFYRARLGHGPDWVSFVEYSAVYSRAGADQHPPIVLFGAMWTLIAAMGSITAFAFVLAHARRFDLLPLCAACWAAIWGCSIYYFGEPFEQHVNMLAVIIVEVGIVAWNVLRAEGVRTATATMVRLSFVPTMVIVIATAYGTPSRIAQMRLPLLPGYHAQFSSQAPVISGGLLRIMQRAGIAPADDVILPNEPGWVKLDLGFIVPFVEGKQHERIEQKAWLPLSPAGEANTLYTLPFARRRIYLERSLSRQRTGGWLITYQEHADCSVLSKALETTRVTASGDYEAAYCAWIRAPSRHSLAIARPHS